MSARLPLLAVSIIDIHFPPDRAHVGSARRLAMDEAFSRAGLNSLLLTTDADAVPAATWIDANLKAIEDGADLIGVAIGMKRRLSALAFYSVRGVISITPGLSISSVPLLIRYPTIPGRAIPIIPALAWQFGQKFTEQWAGFPRFRSGRMSHSSARFVGQAISCVIRSTYKWLFRLASKDGRPAEWRIALRRGFLQRRKDCRSSLKIHSRWQHACVNIGPEVRATKSRRKSFPPRTMNCFRGMPAVKKRSRLISRLSALSK